MSALLIPMYHRVDDPSIPEARMRFSAHLDKLKANYPIVFPGESLPPNRSSVCITFDDAYLDFYDVVFPLLAAKSLKAVLAIPVGYIQETPSWDRTLWKAPLCSWPMIKEMVASKLVYPASHSMTHRHLSRHPDSFQTECIDSKARLEDKLGCAVDTFIYPYGDNSSKIRQKMRSVYTYDMRIGGASNRGWSSRDGLLYRFDAEHYWPNDTFITDRCMRRFQRRYWWNRIRGK